MVKIPEICTWILSKNSDESNLILDHHKISGLCYFFYPSISNSLADAKTAWKYQWQRNIILENWLKEHYDEMVQCWGNVVVLKGMALLSSIYLDYGSRFMSDIDLYVELKDLHLVDKLMEKLDFKYISENRWWGNIYKREYTKVINGEEIVVEIHNQLFFHRKEEELILIEDNRKFKTLSHEWQLIHLIGHLSLQHTFQKLYWMFDVYLFIQKYEKEMDWNILEKLASHYELRKSFSFCFYLLETNFSYKIDDSIKKTFPKITFIHRKILDNRMLIKDDQVGFKYWYLKHIIRDTIKLAIKYDLLWGLNKIKGIFEKYNKS